MKHPDADIKKRVLKAYLAGNSITNLVEIFGFHRNSIRQWVQSADKNPDFKRKENPGSGRPSVFSDKTGKALLKIISRPASFYGFETDFWTTKRLQRVCREKLKIKVSRMAIHRMLIKFEQSYKKPQKQYFK